jgi:hypothetical protein
VLRRARINRELLTLILGICLAGSFGCNRKKELIELDPRFSFNLAPVPPSFPGEDFAALTPNQQEVFLKYGKPDFIRFYWISDGTFITSSDLSGKGPTMEQTIAETKKTWIYTGRNEREVEFLSNGGYVEHPLTEKLRLIARYGDPNDKSPPKRDDRGRVREYWQWIDHGMLIEFLDDQEVNRQHFTATGRGTVLMK